MTDQSTQDPAKLVAKQRARAEILDDLENIKSLLDSDLAKSKELLKKPEFSLSTPAKDNSANQEAAVKSPTAEKAVRKSADAQQRVSRLDPKQKGRGRRIRSTQLTAQRSNSKSLPSDPQSTKSDQQRSTQTTLFQLDSSSQSELSEIQYDAKNRLKQRMEQLVAQQKYQHLRAIQEELETEANILVQDMVDEIIPVIEIELRKRLQQEMEYYVLELLTHPDAPLY